MADYDVGYGKPPKKHQWKPGQSGNPSGKRKKKSTEHMPLVDGLAAELCEVLPVNVAGKQDLVPLAVLLAKTIIRDALKAPLKERMQVIQLLERLGVFEAHKHKIAEMLRDGTEDGLPEYTEEDLHLLAITRRYLDMEDEEMERRSSTGGVGGPYDGDDRDDDDPTPAALP